MEGYITIKGGKAAMQDKRAESFADPGCVESIIGIEMNCTFNGIADKARVISSLMDGFARRPMERMLITVAFLEMEKEHLKCDGKDREQIVFPGDKSSPDGFSDVGMLKSLFDRLSEVD